MRTPLTSLKEGRRNGIQWTLWSLFDDTEFACDLALQCHTHAQIQDNTTCLASPSAGIGLTMARDKDHEDTARINVTVAGQPLKKSFLNLFRKHGRHTGWGSCRRDGEGRYYAIYLSDSQESLDHQRDWKIHQAEYTKHQRKISTPLWIRNTENDSSRTP